MSIKKERQKMALLYKTIRLQELERDPIGNRYLIKKTEVEIQRLKQSLKLIKENW